MPIFEIKKISKESLSGKFVTCFVSTILFFIINSILLFAFSKISKNMNIIIFQILNIIINIISANLGYGITANILNVITDEKDSITNFLDEFIVNFLNYTKLTFFLALRLIIPIIFTVFSYVLTVLIIPLEIAKGNITQTYFIYIGLILLIISIIILFKYLLKYTLAPIIFYESNDKGNSKEILNTSKELMKGNVWNFIKLILTFLPFFLILTVLLNVMILFLPIEILTIILAIAIAFIKPYLTSAIYFFKKEIDE